MLKYKLVLSLLVIALIISLFFTSELLKRNNQLTTLDHVQRILYDGKKTNEEKKTAVRAGKAAFDYNKPLFKFSLTTSKGEVCEESSFFDTDYCPEGEYCYYDCMRDVGDQAYCGALYRYVECLAH